MKTTLKAFVFALASIGFAAVALVWIVYQPSWSSRDVTQRADAAIEPAKLEAHVRRIVGLGPRNWENTEGIGRVKDYLVAELRASGLQPEFQLVEAEGHAFQNVIVKLGPAAGPLRVIGAHYDACESLPGADDNASGVSGLLEIARALAKRPPSDRLELVFYTLEEPPYFATERMGSFVHAKALRQKGEDVRAMISIEMIGYFDDKDGTQEYPLPGLELLYPERGDFIASVGNLESRALARDAREALRVSGISAYSMNAPAFVPGLTFSDHWPYWVQGYSAIMVADSAFLRNRAYHTEGDIPDRLDYRRMAKVVDGVLLWIRDGA